MIAEIKNWLIVMLFVFFIALFGCLFMLYEQKVTKKTLLFNNVENYDFVHEKIPIQKVTIKDLLKIEKLSHRKALLILNFIQKNNVKNIDSLLEINGVGQKTLDRLKNYFY